MGKLKYLAIFLVLLAIPAGIFAGRYDYSPGIILENLTATRLISGNASKLAVSVSDLTAWIAGTANEIEVADDGDGSATIGIVTSPTLDGTNFTGIPDGALDEDYMYGAGAVTSRAIVIFDGVTGRQVQNTTATIGPNGDLGIQSTVAGGRPIFYADNYNADEFGSRFEGWKLSASPADDDQLNVFAGYGSSDEEFAVLNPFGYIEVLSSDVTDATMAGEINAWVKINDVLTKVVSISDLIQFGAIDAGDYSEFEADGTLKFNGDATVWKDINIGAITLSGPIGLRPGLANFIDEAGGDTGIATFGLAVGEGLSGLLELQHDYMEGSDIFFHVHWQGIAAPTGTDKVKFQLTYTIAKTLLTLDAVTVIVVETDFDTQYEFKRSDFAAITGTDFKIEDQFLFTLERIAASADEYGGEALLATVGIHYEQDTVGSRVINTK